jgi:hypothetical protein
MQALFEIFNPDLHDAWADLIVAATPPGCFCHMELRFADGRCFSSREPKGVGWKASIADDPRLWWTLDLPWPESPELIAFCDSLDKLPYWWMGAALSALGEAPQNHAKAFFCSHVCMEILARAGMARMGFIPPPNRAAEYLARVLHQESQLPWDARSKTNAAKLFEAGRRLLVAANDRRSFYLATRSGG